MPDGKARIALIKDDGTWDERFIQTGGVNYGNAATNAEQGIRMDLDRETMVLPEPWIAVKCLSIEWDPDNDDGDNDEDMGWGEDGED
jgi:hypothetical protein